MNVGAKAITLDRLDDLALAKLAAARDVAAVRLITSRNNQRLFRAAWSIVKDRAEAEDVVQEAYAKALAAIGRFEGGSSLSTWLTRIVLNEAADRGRALKRREKFLEDNRVAELSRYREAMMAGSSAPSPEAEAMRVELKSLLETAVARLPQTYRCVFVLREIEGMSLAETAAVLDIPAATVKTRLWRARGGLRRALEPHFTSVLGASVAFAGADCERLTARVLARLGEPRRHIPAGD